MAMTDVLIMIPESTKASMVSAVVQQWYRWTISTTHAYWLQNAVFN